MGMDSKALGSEHRSFQSWIESRILRNSELCFYKWGTGAEQQINDPASTES